MPDNHSPIALVIAMGGQGRRIGGNKPLKRLAGKPLLSYALDFASRQPVEPQHIALSIAHGAHPVEYGLEAALAETDHIHDRDKICGDRAILRDKTPDIGPLGALQQALAFAKEQQCGHVLLVGCDMPFLPDDLTEKLRSALSGHIDAGVAVPEQDGILHNMAALWSVECSEICAAYLQSGRRSLFGLINMVKPVVVPWDNSNSKDDSSKDSKSRRAFFNVNTPDELIQAERYLGEVENHIKIPAPVL